MLSKQNLWPRVHARRDRLVIKLLLSSRMGSLRNSYRHSVALGIDDVHFVIGIEDPHSWQHLIVDNAWAILRRRRTFVQKLLGATSELFDFQIHFFWRFCLVHCRNKLVGPCVYKSSVCVCEVSHSIIKKYLQQK